MSRIFTNNSFKHANEGYKASTNYFKAKPETALEINEYLESFQSLLDLIPQQAPRLFSDHLFPCFEAHVELENSLLCSKMGFYRLGFTSLRSVLELSLLSVFFDRDDKAEETIQAWLKSKESTPFFRSNREQLFKLPRFEFVQNRCDLKGEVEDLYYFLSDYSHTKGIKFSNRRLGNGSSNFNVFNEKSLESFIVAFKSTVRLALALHLTKYPVGLQHTPLDDKFGFNRIIGNFLDPAQAGRLKKLIGTPLIDHLQDLSDQDTESLELAKYIRSLPDMSEAEREAQVVKMYNDSIKMEGWEHWIQTVGAIYLDVSRVSSDAEKKKKGQLRAELERWAKENNFFEFTKAKGEK